jgi:hypothetical protein
MQRDLIPTQWKDILKRAEKAAEKGVQIRFQTAPRGIGVLLGLEATFHPFVGFPTYKTIAHLSLEERVTAMRDPARFTTDTTRSLRNAESAGGGAAAGGNGSRTTEDADLHGRMTSGATRPTRMV